MIHRSNPFKPMIIDACALIDFIKSDRSIIGQIIKYIGPIHVISAVIEEVEDIDNEQEILDLGMIIKEVELQDAFTAASYVGPLSFEDHLCLLTAKRCGYVCITNDKNLRKCCKKESVHILWGLQLLIELHKLNGITSKDAVGIAKAIQKNNPKHITKEIISRFINIITNTSEDNL